MFLIDIKFISKMLKIFLRGSSSCSGACLRGFISSKFQKIEMPDKQVSNFQSFKASKFKIPKLQFSTFRNFENGNSKSEVAEWYTGIPTFSDFQVLRYENKLFKDAPIFFLYLLKYFRDKYGVRGSRFGHMFGRSRNVPKSIAIDQEALICDLGIIKTPKKTTTTLKT